MQCNKIEFLQKKAVRVLFFKSPIAHTEPIFKRMNQLKPTDMYILAIFLTCTTNFTEINFQIILTLNFLPDYTASFVMIFAMTSFVYLGSDVALEKLIQNIRCIIQTA